MNALLRRRGMMGITPKEDDKGWEDGVPYDLSSYASFQNTYIDNNNGRLVRYNKWSSTDFLPCHGVAGFSSSRGRNYNALYDANKNYISGLNLNTGGYVNNPHPEAYYVRFSYYTHEFPSLSITPYD